MKPFLITLGVLSGCFVLFLGAAAVVIFSSWEEHICSDGEYPTWRPDGPGAACFQDGSDPQRGYVAYPEGDVPALLEDSYEPLSRYPALKPWVREYVTWQKSAGTEPPPAMPEVG